jgi:alkanesulfonate monooxygenase SsuD/methylene tetrahydromethanopterin reductase-like flavin-dependent oxidoreductase (luciferase family)
VRIGIGLPNTIPGAPGSLLVEWARQADERGFSTVATIDRVAYPSYESLIALSAAGAVTERVGLMTNILLAPARSAILLAKEAASVDQISGGRLTLGLAVGSRRDDYEAAGLEFSRRGKRFDQDLEVILAAWRGELVAGCLNPPTPTPVRDKRIPILFGGMSDRAIERVLALGDGWTAGGAASEIVGPFGDRIRAAWRDAGREGEPRIVALSYFSITNEEESRANLLDYYGSADWARQLADGTPRGQGAVKDAVKRFEDARVDELILDPSVADIAELELLAEAVL